MYPYLYVETEKNHPSNITIYALANGNQYKYVKIPSRISFMPDESKIVALKAIIKRYRKKNNCICPFFGKIKSFKAVFDNRSIFNFDSQGNFSGKVKEDLPLKPLIAYCTL